MVKHNVKFSMLYIFTEINETVECTIKEQKAIKTDHI